MNLFIDECLSDTLTDMAIDRGHWGSASVKRRNLLGIKDWDLLRVVLEGDFTLVTRNAEDFRGAAHAPGVRGLYSRVHLHAGLVCLNGPPGMKRAMQRELFAVALDDLDALGHDLVNKALEVSLGNDGSDLVVSIYNLPRP